MGYFYYWVGWTHQEGQGRYILVSYNNVPQLEFDALVRKEIRVAARELLITKKGKIDYIGTIDMFGILIPRLAKYGFQRVKYSASFELAEGDNIIFRYDAFNLEPVFGADLFNELVKHNEEVERGVFEPIGSDEDDSILEE